MSRIGKQILTIPTNCEVVVKEGNLVTVKGTKGEISQQFKPLFDIKIEDGKIEVIRPNENKSTLALHGTTTSIINNMIIGVNDGYKKELELNGVGYRAQLKGNILILLVGYSHPVEMEIPSNLTVEVPTQTEIVISGIDKQAVGEFAAKVRINRKPEPYKGKGIKYKEEIIRRKEGKRAGK